MQVHTWTKDNITSILQRLITNRLTHLLHQIGVPCGSKAGTDRKSCCGIGVRVVLTLGVNMYAGRSVTQHGGRNTQPLNSHGDTCCAGNQSFLVSQHGS